jgi:hypothetical protein
MVIIIQKRKIFHLSLGHTKLVSTLSNIQFEEGIFQMIQKCYTKKPLTIISSLTNFKSI